jgi:hypothetical protein
MNVLYPFVPERCFDDVLDPLSKALDAAKPFQVHFDHLGNFGGTVFLVPDAQEELCHLHACCKAALPVLPEKHATYQAHLTIGQFKGGPGAAKFIAEHNDISITTQFSQIALLARDNMKSPFRTKYLISLGGIGWKRGDNKPYVANTPWTWTCACLPECSSGVASMTRTLSDGIVRTLSRSLSKDTTTDETNLNVRGRERLEEDEWPCLGVATYKPFVKKW